MSFDLGILRGGGRATVWTSLCSTLLPLMMGAALALTLVSSHHQGSSVGFVLFFAVAMSVTAFPVLARIIADRELANTRVGAIALACAAITDLLAWTLLAVVAAIATGERLDWRPALLVPYVALMVTAVRPLLRRAARKVPEDAPGGRTGSRTSPPPGREPRIVPSQNREVTDTKSR
ncbi:cation:proton antiporter [Streptomyces sp. NPDC099050]|uniref:cation:proton antiporter domain-containing protein n=1 Tax=Streptomyces sp. NPDC099050 TaxID=3366100 RepID=UPI003820A828